MTEKSGVFAVVGRPNVGKSTLINALVGEKVSITANRPQTTRHSIMGIATEGDYQMVFIDTPGIHQTARKTLNRQLNKAARAAFEDVDLIVMLFRVLRWTEEDQRVLEDIQRSGKPYILVPNMMDRVQDKAEAADFMRSLPGVAEAAAVVPISAARGRNLDRLTAVLQEHCERDEFLYDPDLYTDKPMRFIAAELVREQATRLLDSELPYALTVLVDSFELQAQRYFIQATIWVERESQKAIVIGKGGQQLKQIGTLARKAMMHQFGNKVHLELVVKVRKDWSDNLAALRALGYQDGPDAQ